VALLDTPFESVAGAIAGVIEAAMAPIGVIEASHMRH
jgi:hypothetical protein